MAIKLVSRAQWGARAYRLPNGATEYTGSRRGVKVHYLGTPYTDRAHDRCDDYVRQIQAQHMDGTGWSDIGYSFVVCTHGYVYEGRGLRRRNSANGNTTLNNQDYAVLLMVGSSGLTKPTDAQLHGARDAIDYCRKSGPAGSWLGGHRDGYATACPGDTVYAWVKAGAPRPSTIEQEDEVTPEDIQKIAKATVDMLTGPRRADLVAAIFMTDNVLENPNPATVEKNPKVWAYTLLKNAEIIHRRVDDNVKSIAAKVDGLTVGGVDVNALAALLAPLVADELAARLAD